MEIEVRARVFDSNDLRFSASFVVYACLKKSRFQVLIDSLGCCLILIEILIFVRKMRFLTPESLFMVLDCGILDSGGVFPWIWGLLD